MLEVGGGGRKTSMKCGISCRRGAYDEHGMS